jgi:lycopene epsilon-cyclase
MRRVVTLAAGAAAGKFLEYEQNAPTVAAQTAYGVEAQVGWPPHSHKRSDPP